MKSFYVRKLLFALVRDPNLVEEATGWKASDVNLKKYQSVKFIRKYEDNDKAVLFYEGYEHKCVEAVYGLLCVLDEDTLAKKASKIMDMQVKESWFGKKNIPDAMSTSDIEFWARKPGWDAGEAAMLSLGFVLNDECCYPIDEIMEYGSYEKEIVPLFCEYDERLKLIGSARQTGILSKNETSLGYLNWLKRVELSIPTNLVEQVMHYQKIESESLNRRPKRQDEAKLSESERISLLKLIAAMAIKGYCFDPNKSRNQATSEIEDDLNLLGLGLDQKTILKWLREATSLIDPENLK